MIALLKRCETVRRRGRTWLAWSQAPKGRSSRFPLGPPLPLRPSGLLLPIHAAAWRALTGKRFGGRGLTEDLVQTKRARTRALGPFGIRRIGPRRCKDRVGLEAGTQARSAARLSATPGPARSLPSPPWSGLSPRVPSSPRCAPFPTGRGRRPPSSGVEWRARAGRASIQMRGQILGFGFKKPNSISVRSWEHTHPTLLSLP